MTALPRENPKVALVAEPFKADGEQYRSKAVDRIERTVNNADAAFKTMWRIIKQYNVSTITPKKQPAKKIQNSLE